MGTEPSIDAIRAVVQRHLPRAGYHAYLFGSRARGTARAMSDWDIGILGPGRMRGATLEALREDLDELPTLHQFDVVDLATVSREFQAHALSAAVFLV